MIIDMTPTGMARALTRRHSDLGFVRSYVISHFGKAPSREKLMEMRAEYVRELEREKAIADRLTGDFKFTCGHDQIADNMEERDDGGITCLACKRARDAAAAARYRERKAKEAARVIAKRKPTIWPQWYRKPKNVPVEEVAAHAAALSGWDVIAIQGQGKTDDILRVRFSVYLVAKEAGHPLTVIGRRLGGRDHSSVSNGCKRALYLAKNDPDFAAFLKRLRDSISAGSEALAA